jgi:hypothetical protein
MSRENVHGYRVALTQTRLARKHRTVLEKILVRFPTLARQALYLWSQLPSSSRLRRLFLVRLIGQAANAVNRRDFDVLMLGLDPGIDYQTISGPRGSVMPDIVGRHHGHSGYRELWRLIMEGFEDLTLEPQEVLDLGDKLISETRLTGHGSSSGIPLDNQILFQVFTLRRGLVVKQEDFGSREEALEAAGVRG